MEFINGSDLELLMQKTKELPNDKIVEWAIDLCDVLDYLHNQRPEPIVFRDMKPSNVMIDSLGRVRLIDFGIAKNLENIAVVRHTMIGTEGYSAPEQYKGDVSPRSDIYSLGATLHHLLTRKDPRLDAPFTFHERPITNFNPKVPPALIAIVEKALGYNPGDRYATCAEMKSDLEKLRGRAPVAAPGATPGAPGAPGETGMFEDVSATGIQPRWKFKTEDEIRAGVASFKDLVFVGSYDNNMWAVKAEGGELAWKFPTKGGIAATPTLDDNGRMVIFGSEDNNVYCLDARSGRMIWNHQTKGRVRSSARIAHDHVFVGSDDCKLYALSSASGRPLWSFDMGGPVRSRPWITNDSVYCACDTGEIVCLSLSGQRKWAYRTKRSVLASPVLDADGICYIGSQDGFMYALDAGNGFVLWRYRTNGPIIATAVLQGGYIYFGSADSVMYCLQTETARERWKFSASKPIVSAAAVHKEVVLVASTDETLYCVDLELGRERWRYKAGGPLTGAPLVVSNLILFGSMDRSLYALPLVL
jgi:outer membrane protein assembly factor BamB